MALTFSSNFNFSLFSSSSKTTPRCLSLIKFTMKGNNQQHQSLPKWASLRSEINTHILKSIPASPPLAVSDPMHRLISIAPLSVASALCLATCQLVGGRKDQAMNAACAIQLAHVASHAHTLFLKQEHVLAPGVQLMTGDGILPLGYEMVTRGVHVDDYERVVRVIVEMTRAMGPQGMVEGQLAETEGGGEPTEWVWERKGGRLSACGATCGAILGGGREDDVEKLRRFGWYVGMMNEMTISDSGKNCSEVFRSLAMLELQGFDEGKADDVAGLFLE